MSTSPKAEQIEFIPSGGLSATNLQAALNELDSDKATTANLAAPSGSSVIGYDTGTVQDVLDAVTGPTGAASVGYTPAGTGAVATTVEEKLRSIPVSPEEYGAVGDGVTNDTAALVACHQSGRSVSYGKGKSYVVKSANALQLIDGCSYIGNGATIIVPADANAPGVNDLWRMGNNIFYRNTNTALANDIVISGFNVDIRRSYWNFIGAANTAAYANGGKFVICSNSIKNNGTPSGLGGPDTATFSPGGFCVLAGYDCDVYDNEVQDCGVGIACTNGTNLLVRDNRLFYCGVSRDFTSWSNAAALAIPNNTYVRAIDNYIYVTGGTSVFCRSEWRETKELYVTGNVIIGSGNSAIGAGYRGAQAVNFTTDSLVVKNNNIYGATCGIGSNAHGPIIIAISSGPVNCRIKNVDVDSYVNSLAPWETFNHTTNEVDGSYNTLKKAGGNIGAQQSILVYTDTGSFIDRAIVRGKLFNESGYGVTCQNLSYAEIDVIVDNCAWNRTAANAPNPACRSLQVKGCGDVSVMANITNHARGVSQNNSLASAVEFTDNDSIHAKLRIDKSSNQRACVYVRQDKANCKLHFDSLYFDNPEYVSGAPTTIVEAGSQVKLSTEFTGNIDYSMKLGGNIYIPIGAKSVVSGTTNYNLYLSSAKRSKNSRILISAKSFNITLVVEGGETIDGSTSPITVAAGTKRFLYSDGAAWTTLD